MLSIFGDKNMNILVTAPVPIGPFDSGLLSVWDWVKCYWVVGLGLEININIFSVFLTYAFLKGFWT